MIVKINCPHCQSTKARIDMTLTNTTRYKCVLCHRLFYSAELKREVFAKVVKIPTFHARKHQNKEAAFVEALKSEYTFQEDNDLADIVLFDYDVAGNGKRFDFLASNGTRLFFVYPHSGRPSVINDLYAPSPRTTAQFVYSDGHVEIMRRYGYEKPLIVCGWSLSPLLEFTPREVETPDVLFAPIHPMMSDDDKKLNAATHEVLSDLANRGKIKLTVRFINSLELSGIYKLCSSANYCEGSQDSDYSQIINHDLIVGHQTYAYMAVALGKPVLMMGEWIAPHNFTKNNGKCIYVNNWNLYKDLMMYPLDILDTQDALGLIHSAMKSDAAIAEWRERMIGKPFDAGAVRDAVKLYLA